MEIQTIDSAALSRLYEQQQRRILVVLLVVPHHLSDDGLCYVMWGPRRGDLWGTDLVTVVDLPEIRGVDRMMLRDWSYQFMRVPSHQGIDDVGMIDAEGLLADDGFWAPGEASHAELRPLVRALVATPQARAARAKFAAIFGHGFEPAQLAAEDFDPNGNMGSQN